MHLFFHCNVASCCLLVVRNWVGWNMKEVDLHKIVHWIQRARVYSFQKKLFSAVAVALIYWIWHSRNRRIWNNEEVTSVDIINNVKRVVRNRLLGLGCRKGEVQFFYSFINL